MCISHDVQFAGGSTRALAKQLVELSLPPSSRRVGCTLQPFRHLESFISNSCHRALHYRPRPLAWAPLQAYRHTRKREPRPACALSPPSRVESTCVGLELGPTRSLPSNKTLQLPGNCIFAFCVSRTASQSSQQTRIREGSARRAFGSTLQFRAAQLLIFWTEPSRQDSRTSSPKRSQLRDAFHLHDRNLSPHRRLFGGQASSCSPRHLPTRWLRDLSHTLSSNRQKGRSASDPARRQTPVTTATEPDLRRPCPGLRRRVGVLLDLAIACHWLRSAGSRRYTAVYQLNTFSIGAIRSVV